MFNANKVLQKSTESTEAVVKYIAYFFANHRKAPTCYCA